MVKLLNVGCGSIFDSSWTNLDLVSSSPDVQSHDIRQGLPYPDEYFDACYHSHVLEHQTPKDADKLLAECWRVLKPQGILRVVVPDLESIVRNYIQILDKLEAGFREEEANYDWIMLELYDQCVRTCWGGEMCRYLSSPEIKNKEFILSRIGCQAEVYWKKLNHGFKEEENIWQKITRKELSWFIPKIKTLIALKLVGLILGQEGSRAFDEGFFRYYSGQIHHWMYDRFSLSRLLEKIGFVDIQVCSATTSRIPNFNSYKLDIIEGKIRKPDSLFMEGIKP
jgi:SAM-dependent methyltransferase